MTTTTIEETQLGKSKNYYKRAGMNKVANVELPEEVTNNFTGLTKSNLKNLRNDYIIALINAGWTNVSVAKSAGLSNEMVRIIRSKHTAEPVPPTLIIPEVPKHEPKSKSSLTIYALPPVELLERLRELKPIAQKVRANSPRYRAEAEEYSYLLNEAHTVHGVSMYRLGKLLGVTTSGLVFRLVRYGYKTSNGDSRVYRQINASNRRAIP